MERNDGGSREPSGDSLNSLLAQARGRGPGDFSLEAKNALREYSFPGNARELRNIVGTAIIKSQFGVILPNICTIRLPLRQFRYALTFSRGRRTRRYYGGAGKSQVEPQARGQEPRHALLHPALQAQTTGD